MVLCDPNRHFLDAGNLAFSLNGSTFVMKVKASIRRFLKQLKDPMIIILIVAAVVSGVLAVVENENEGITFFLKHKSGEPRPRRVMPPIFDCGAWASRTSCGIFHAKLPAAMARPASYRSNPSGNQD